MTRNVTPDQIDQLLPQTQCGLCTHGGCMPYAKAIINEQAPLNLCPPGGVVTLQALGELMQEEVAGFMDDMHLKAKPPLVALIREAECIGCTKCIAACPVDAIIGSAKSMHTVISDECTGCELCVAPCPVDCIDMVATTAPVIDKRDQYRKRYATHQQRTQSAQQEKMIETPVNSVVERQSYIQEALARARLKKKVE